MEAKVNKIFENPDLVVEVIRRACLVEPALVREVLKEVAHVSA